MPGATRRTLRRHRWFGRNPARLPPGHVRRGHLPPERSPSNLEKLAAALREMGARIRTSAVPDGLPFACDAAFLGRVDLRNLMTSLGDLDLSFQPAGTGGFDDLISRATSIKIKGSDVRVAALEDVIRSKEAAARPKDQRTLPILRQLLAEIQARRDDGDKP